MEEWIMRFARFCARLTQCSAVISERTFSVVMIPLPLDGVGMSPARQGSAASPTPRPRSRRETPPSSTGRPGGAGAPLRPARRRARADRGHARPAFGHHRFLGWRRLPRRAGRASTAPPTSLSTCCSRAPSAARRWKSPPPLTRSAANPTPPRRRKAPATSPACWTPTCPWPSTSLPTWSPPR